MAVGVTRTSGCIALTMKVDFAGPNFVCPDSVLRLHHDSHFMTNLDCESANAFQIL